MYMFRIYKGPHLVRVYNQPYPVSTYVKQAVSRSDYVVEITNAEDGDRYEVVVERVTGKVWLLNNLEKEYRQRMRNKRQFLQYARRRAFYRAAGRDATRPDNNAVFDSGSITRETKKLLWRS